MTKELGIEDTGEMVNSTLPAALLSVTGKAGDIDGVLSPPPMRKGLPRRS